MQGQVEIISSRSGGAQSRLGRWYWRMPLKAAIFVLITLFVLFPYPRQLRQHLEHVMNMQAMVQPDAPELAAWDEKLELIKTNPLGGSPNWEWFVETAKKAGRPPPSEQWLKERRLSEARAIQQHVETFVLEQVKYEWDWETWGSADYMPSVKEMFDDARRNGGELREDCDGRAVIAASILRRMGYDAQLVTDLRHVWVSTPEAELMGPGGTKTLVTTTQGTQMDLPSMAYNVPISLSFGIAVFPLWRELVIALAAVLLLSWRRVPPRIGLFAGLLVVQGLLFMRLGYISPRTVSADVNAWPSVVGMGHVLSGLILLFYSSLRGRHVATRIFV